MGEGWGRCLGGLVAAEGWTQLPWKRPPWLQKGCTRVTTLRGAGGGGDVLVASEDRAGWHEIEIQGMRTKVQKSSVRHA